MPRRLNISCEQLHTLYGEKQQTLAEIAVQFRCSPVTIHKRLKACGIKARPSGGSVFEYPKKDFNGSFFEKAYLIGFRLGDLHVELGNWAIRVRCTSTHQEQIDLVRELFEPYGGVWISEPKTRRGTGITAHLNRSFDFLVRQEDTIEPWILNDNDLFAAFWAGYIDAEGSFINTGNRAYFKVDSGDQGILLQAWQKLTELGLQFPKPQLIRPAGTWINQFKLSSHRDLWRLTTEKKTTLLQLCDLISPHLRHQRRIRAMQAVRSNVASRISI
jgi:hypothetical protein